LTFIGLGQFWLSHIASGGSYDVNVLPGLLLTAFGMGLAFPATSVGAITGVAPNQQGSAAALFNTSEQVGSAVGLSILATIAASSARGVGGTLSGGFRVSYLVGTGIAVLGIVLVATMLSGRQCQLELAVQSGASRLVDDSSEHA
jgi:hypothetical protein